MDWDAAVGAVLDACQESFGYSVEYSHNGSAPISIIGIYDAAHVSVDPDTGAAITSEDPILGISAADLPGKPTKSDTLTITRTNGEYLGSFQVIDSEPDGQGGINLVLKIL